MSLSKLAERRMRAAEAAAPLAAAPLAAAPLAADTLDGLSGDALREALLARVADALPREGNALRRAAKARGAVARAGTDPSRLRDDLAQAELAAAMLRERTGRHLLTRTLVAERAAAPTSGEHDDEG